MLTPGSQRQILWNLQFANRKSGVTYRPTGTHRKLEIILVVDRPELRGLLIPPRAPRSFPQRNAAPEQKRAIMERLEERLEKINSGAAQKEADESRAAFEAKANKHPVLWAEFQKKAAEPSALGMPDTREEIKRRRDEMNAVRAAIVRGNSLPKRKIATHSAGTRNCPTVPPIKALPPGVIPTAWATCPYR
jgi:hypothetical protein